MGNHQPSYRDFPVDWSMYEEHTRKAREIFRRYHYVLAALVRWKRLEMHIVRLRIRENTAGRFLWRRDEIVHIGKFGGMELFGAIETLYTSITKMDEFKDHVIYYNSTCRPGMRVSDYFLADLTGIQAPVCRDWVRDNIELYQ